MLKKVEYLWSGPTKRCNKLSKSGPIFGPFTFQMEKYFVDNILTPYIFEKVMVLTLERVQTDFDHTNMVIVLVHCKK